MNPLFKSYYLSIAVMVLIFPGQQLRGYACPTPSYLTLNYTFTTAIAGDTVEVTWASDCPEAFMEITLVNVPLWAGQQFYGNVPNTGSYLFAINSGIIPGESLFFIRNMQNEIWDYGPYFDLMAPLPVELVTFNGKLDRNNSTVLNWKTATEVNNLGFEIERSADGRNWDEIGFIDGHGTSFEIRNYEFIDQFTPNGISYYRLKQIDFDNNFEYSKVIQIIVKLSEINFWIYPNPVNDAIHMYFKNPASSDLKVNVIGLNGHILYQQTLLEKELSFTIPDLDIPAGVYFLEVSRGASRLQIEKFIKL